MEKIRRVLLLRNPWWFGKRVEVPQTKRRLFGLIASCLDDERAIQIVGLRRTGKTTLLLQVIDRLLSEGVDPQRLLYLSMDSVEFQGMETPIVEAFHYYYEIIAPKEGRLYLFIDEAHFSESWAREVKNLWDTFRPKIFITGSSALGLLKSCQESLVGRVRSFYLPPLSLTEFGDLSGTPIGHDLPEVFSGEDFTQELTALHRDPVTFERLKLSIKPIFENYLTRGGFPEGVFAGRLDRYLMDVREDIIDRVLYKDIPEIFGIRDRRVLRDLFVLLVYNSGHLFSYNSLAQTLGAKVETVSAYIQYLSASDLVVLLPKYARTAEAVLRTPKKIYVADPAIRSALLGELDPRGEGERLGREIELLVSVQLYFSARTRGITLSYWRNRYEVDLVARGLDRTLPPVPIEVKHKAEIAADELEGLQAFIRSEHPKTAFVVTREDFKIEIIDGSEVFFIPVWLFLLGI